MENNFDIHKWRAQHLNEITGEGLDRLEGMIDRPLLRTFLEAFDEMYNDLIDNGEEFEPGDVIEFLSHQMHEWARDSRMSASGPTSYTVTEGSIAIRTYKAGKKDPIGHVDTTLIDQLVAQIGPHVGYSDWENRLQLTTNNYQNIIQYIAKQLTGAGTLQSDRVEFI